MGTCKSVQTLIINMDKVNLISIQSIKNNSVLPVNIDEDIIQIALNEATDLELEPLIGAEYIANMRAKIAEDSTTETDNFVLDEVIEPFLIYATIAYGIDYLHLKINNKGINVSTDATLSALQIKDKDSAITTVKQKMDGYKIRLIRYFASDNDESTNTSIDADSTFNSMNIYLGDNIDYSAQYYRERASKVNYYRRGY